jgi:hypothetical protein
VICLLTCEVVCARLNINLCILFYKDYKIIFFENFACLNFFGYILCFLIGIILIEFVWGGVIGSSSGSLSGGLGSSPGPCSFVYNIRINDAVFEVKIWFLFILKFYCFFLIYNDIFFF